MKGRQIDQMVYEYMFPRPKSNDPSNFHALLQRSLIPEVRQETHAFYGHLDTQEAKYPGLDYTHSTHRIRLSRWPWHRRLFRAFDGLRLTNAEIAGLTKWEGTKWAKEKFEREQGVKIRDTASDGMLDAVEIENWFPKRDKTVTTENRKLGLYDEEDKDDMDLESDDELESVGVELNERLRAQAARREAGDTSAVLDEEWEQWLKNAIDTGELSFFTEQVFRLTNDEAIAPLIPPSMLSAARADRWSEIPEFLHPVIRRTLDSGNSTHSSVTSHQPVYTTPGFAAHLRTLMQESHRNRVPWPRRTYSDLRLPPLGDSGTSHRAAEASGA